MRSFWILGLAALLLAAPCGRTALAQGGGASALRIDWEVKNRFRLFRSEADFDRHVAAYRNDGVLGAEERLARDSDGRGWARDVVERLCVNRAGKLMEFCDRDGGREVYLAPREHPIGVVLAGPIPANVSCAWSFDDGEGEPRRATVPCDEEIKLRVAYGRPTLVSVDIVLPDSTAQRVVTEIAVRDVLIAGLGDSIAAGEGNPDRPVRLADGGFCFRRCQLSRRAGNVEFAADAALETAPNKPNLLFAQIDRAVDGRNLRIEGAKSKIILRYIRLER